MNELEMFRKPDVSETIKSRSGLYIRIAWQKHFDIRTVLEKKSTGKRSLRRSRMRQEDMVKKDVETLGGDFGLDGKSNRQKSLKDLMFDGIWS